MKTIDFSHIPLIYLKNYIYKISPQLFLFSILIIDNIIEIPIEFAASFFRKISELLENDSTVREYNINIDFHNQEYIEQILNIFTNQIEINFEFQIETENDFQDIILFSKELGCDMILSYLKEYYSNEVENLTKENAISILSYSTLIGHFNIVNKIISFISSHFYDFIEYSDFFEWCLNEENFDHLESILSNENLKIYDENQLLNFILKLSQEDHKYELFFGKIYLEYCDLSSVKLFINYISTQIPEFQIIKIQNILSCISRRLYQGQKLPLQFSNLPVRYLIKNITNLLTIISNTGEEISDKYIEKINDKSYKFLYPSEDQTTCKSIFKLQLKPGNYKLECVGASGGKGISKEGGFGGYSSGVLSLSKISEIFLFIGGQGFSKSGPDKTDVPGGFNGGGMGQIGTDELPAGSGGGATDIRLNSENIKDRIIVAGGGGGSAGYDKDIRDSQGGNGGGNIGLNGTTHYQNKFGTGGSQDKPGICNNNGEGTSGNNNTGGNGAGSGSSGGGGGGGYFGGGGGWYAGGGGGSGYVSDKLQSKFGVFKETKTFNNIGNGYIIISILN